MKPAVQRNTLPLLMTALWLIFIGLSQFSVNSRAQDKTQLPARAGFVNDFAGVLDDATKERLEVMLASLKQRSGIEFGIATIQSTGGRNIFDVSREFASEWNLGARNGKKKSLLLVVAVDEKTAFTQFSRSVQTDLPEGALGELSQVMRGSLSSGRFNQGVNDGVTHFIGLVAKKAGFAAEDIDQAQVASAKISEPISVSSPVADASESPRVVEPNPETAAATRPRKVNTSNEAVATAPKSNPPPGKTVVAKPSVSPRINTAEDEAEPKSNPPPAKTAAAKPIASPRINTAEDDADEAEEVELVLTLPLAERPAKLKAFLEAFPDSKSRPRAIELLISTYAALGDLKLKDGDRAAGLEQFSLTIGEAPVSITDQLFANVVAQIPSNLYLRGEREAAFDAARQIEAKFGADPKRLLVLSAFYLGVEEGEEAARLASQAVKLAPQMADAHRALGLGLHVALRLDEAAVEYKRALDLDPNTKKATRRSLADLDRASGRSQAALALYREQLAVDPNDRAARAGLILSLFELGRTAEGQKELDTALASDPRDLTLLSGAAYWFAAHDDSERALELAQRAVQLEPRYTWAQVAFARALSGQKRPLEAERAIRFATQYGKFPTLDYELATVLASLGLYDEAAEVLQRSFSYERGRISTRLGGRVLTRADNFPELLALERRASIFQFTGADRPGDAVLLKALLAFVEATGASEKVDEQRAAAAAKEFASGTDKMLAYRQIYAANRLLRLGVALPTVLELTEAARSTVDVALEVPGTTVAVQAEELRDMRARALAQGGTPDVPDAPRNVLGNIMRGRLEDLTGLALFRQDKVALSIDHFRRAVAVLPEGTPAWRNALWHLGTALDQEQQREEALTYYIRGYNAGDPDPVRRMVIEELYRKMNGSLAGLDERIGASAASTFSRPVETPVALAATPESTPVAAEIATEKASPSPVEPTAATTPAAEPAVQPITTPSPEVTPEATPAASPVVEATPEPKASPATPESSPAAPEATPSVTPVATPVPNRSRETDSPVGEMLPTLPAAIKLTGKVKNAAGEPIANVVVVLISPRGSVLSSTTDVDGNFSFVIPPSTQAYRIIPSKDGFAFTPVDRVLPGLTADQKDVDFVAEAVKPG